MVYADKKRRNHRANGAAVSRTVGMAADFGINRADVKAGTTADAAQRFAKFTVGQYERASIVEDNEVKGLRAVDLTGLPPTLEEIDRFLADTSPQSYERLVDRLLASQRYGERMAAAWLDAARYSDTYGYQVDSDRYVWPWRDWVIRAFKINMPFNEFLT